MYFGLVLFGTIVIKVVFYELCTIKCQNILLTYVIIIHIPRSEFCREYVSTGAASAQTRRSLGHHLLHPQILRLLLLLAPTDFEAQSSLL